MKQKVLLIIPNLDPGGAQLSFFNLCKALSEKYQLLPCVYTLPNSPNQYTKLENIISLTSINKNKIFKFLQIFNNLRKLKIKKAPIACISFMESANYLNVLTRGSEKVIISHRGSYLNDDEIKSKFSWLRISVLMPLLFKRADLSVSVSNALREELIGKFSLLPLKQRVIYNFYEIDQLKEKISQPLPSKYNFLKSRKYIVAVGRLHIQKGFKELIQTYNHIYSKTDCQLVIVGDGTLKSELIETCERLKLSYSTPEFENKKASVIFCGYIENPLPIIKKC